MAPRIARIVVVGGGVVGVPLAYELKASLHGRVDVTVVSDSPQLHFFPANPWLALGLRAEEDVSFALEPLLAARKIGFRPQALAAIHPDDSRLRLADGSELQYDYLALATGTRPDWQRVPCSGAETNVHSIVRSQDAVAARAAYDEFLRQPGAVVVVAAPGAPTLGPMYEYAFLLDADLRRRAQRKRVPITVVTPEPYPGHLGLDKPVVRDELTAALEAQGIGWIGNAAVRDCQDGHLKIAVHDDPGHTVERSIDFAYAMVWPPIRGIDPVAQCTPIADEHGLVVVDDCQRARGYANIFALGPCTARPLLTQTPVPVGMPAMVYVVQQLVGIVARNIAHSLQGEPLIRTSVEQQRWIEDQGKRGAAVLAAPQIPLRDIAHLRQGHWVYQAKREFEDYFINQVLFGAGRHGQVAALVRRLSSSPGRGAVPPAASRLGENLTLSVDVRRNLEALARHLGVGAEDFGRQLLEKAVAEALACLDPQTRQRAQGEVRTRLADELEAKQERERFEGGAP